MPEKKPQIHTFDNGLRLVYEPHPAKIPQTHIRAFCHVGSIHEPDTIRGASHFIEHMCFKGSRAFPSWSAVNDPFSQSGANLNAMTTKQYTCFVVDCLDSYVHQFLRILGDIMLRSKFNEKEYKLELNVVREEMKMKKPDSFIEKLAFSGSAYENWVDHDSYHKPGCLQYNEVVEFYHQYYVPQNIVISIVSSISFDTIVRHISSTPFAETLPRPKRIMPILNSTLGALDSHCESNYMLHSDPGEVARIEIAVRVCDQFKNEEFHALNVLRHIVSNSMSSRLFVELREKRGLTYRSGAYMKLYETAGIFVLYAISDITRLIKDGKSSNPGVIPVIFDVLDDLIKNGVNETELKRAKNSIKDSLKMSVIAGGDKSAYNGIRVMLHNDTEILPNSEVYDKCYKKITKSNINAIIQKYFASRNYYFSVIGGNLPKSEVLVNFLSPLKKTKK
jgi:predicted Zn-dependent peptidase